MNIFPLIKTVNAQDDIPGGAPAQLSGLENIFGNIVSISIAIAGIALFVMLIISGYKYIMAGSDAKAAESAKNTLTYAIYGIVLLALAYLILRLIANFTGVESILNFQIEQP